MTKAIYGVFLLLGALVKGGLCRMKDASDENKHVMHSLESIPLSCNCCKFYEDGVRDDYGEYHTVCTYMPPSQMWLTPFEVIDGIDTSKERMWWCHYNSVEQRGKQERKD